MHVSMSHRFELPVGFNIQPTQIPYEAYKGVYSIHHVAWWKDDFYRSLDRCETEVDCKECCRRAVKARCGDVPLWRPVIVLTIAWLPQDARVGAT